MHTPSIWLAIGWGEGSAQNRLVRSTAEMVDWLWEQCGPDHTGDEGLTRAFWSEYLLDDDNWQHLYNDVRRWHCRIDVGETGHIEFTQLLDEVARANNSHAQLLRDKQALVEALDGICTAYKSHGNTKRQREAFATARALLSQVAP